MKAKLFFLGAFLILMVGFEMKSQTCTAGFTYTISTAGQVNFTSTSTGTAINGNTYYNWYYGDSTGTINGGGSPTHTYQYNGTYKAQLNISDISGAVYCIDTISLVISNTQNPPCPNPAFTYTVGQQGTVSFSLQSYTGHNYWAFGDGTGLNDIGSPFHNYSQNGTYTVTCYGQYFPGVTCDTFSQVITINALCHADFTAVNDTLHHQFILYDNSFGADSVFYSINGAPSIAKAYNGMTDTLHNVPLGIDTIYQYIIGNSGACTDGKVIYLNSSACTINVTYTVGCSQATFSVTSNQFISQPHWYINGVMVSSSLNPVISYSGTACYIKYDLVGSGCQKTDSVFVQFGPSANFYLAPDTALGPHNWNVYVNNQPNYTSYLWNWGDGTTSSTAFPTHNYANPGWYTICLTIHDNCGDSATSCQNDSVYKTSSTMVGITVKPQNVVSGIVNNNAGKIKIYPVPATDLILLENLEGATLAELFDNEGRRVLSESLISSGNKAQVNIESVAKGFYILKIYSGNAIWQKKIIKQ